MTFETEEEAKKLQTEADNIILKERKLNIAPAIKKQQPYTRTYEMGQPVMNGALYYHNGIPYTYQNGVALFQDGVIGPANPNASSQNSAAAAAALAAANSQIPPGAFMIPHAMAAAATQQQQQQQQQAAAAAMFLPAADSAAAAAAAQQFSTYQQQAAAVAALQQQQQQQISGVGPQTSSCSTTNSSSISGATNGNAPWRWVSQASSNPVTNGHGGGHGTSSPVTPHHHQQQQMAFQQVHNEGQPPSTPTLFYNSGSSIVNPAPGYGTNGIGLVANATSYALGQDGLWYGYHTPGNGTPYVTTPTWDMANCSPKDLGYVSMNANDTTGSSFNFNNETMITFEGSTEQAQSDEQPAEKGQGDEVKIGSSTTSSSYVPSTPSYLYSAPPQYAPPTPQMPFSPSGWNYVPREGTFGMNAPWTMPAPGMTTQDPQTPYRTNPKARHDNDVRKMSYELQSGVRNGPKKYDGIKGHYGSSRNSTAVPGSSAAPSFDNNGYGLMPMWSDMNNNNSHHRENASSYNRANHRGTRNQDYSRPPVPLLSRGGSLLGRPFQFDSLQGRSNPKAWFNNNNNSSGRKPPNSNTFRKSENRRGGLQNRDMSDHNVGVCHVCPAHSPTKPKSAHRPSSFGANLKHSKTGGKTGVEEAGKAE